MKNRMSDLRNHLFETLERLKDEDSPMDLNRAKTISEVAQTIINSAKVEVEFAKAMGEAANGDFFFPPKAEALLPAGEKPRMIRSVASRKEGNL